jgi:CRISPR-associated endonuclease Cas1
MNAKFLEKMILFRKEHGLDFTKTILGQKITYQFSILNLRDASFPFIKKLNKCNSIQNCLLIEAQAAKVYWKSFGKEIDSKIDWKSRRPRQKDVCNRLLDIGYRFLANKTLKLFEKIDLASELGVFHKAQSKSASPLVYDFIEWLRPIVVDRVVLKFLRRKKKELHELKSKDIKYFIHLIKLEYERPYYSRELKYCISLDYWIRMVALKLMKSVNKDVDFSPSFPSLRNETRCNKQKTI